jgi:D-3-phosphoglycerate dehydrogenase / 2-oxoglutarate reductase
MRILLSTTSYQDTPGAHHDLLASSGFEIIRARGPLNEAQMLDLIKQHDGFDGLLNGDDQINAKVIDTCLATSAKLKVISKYGIGLDSIDQKHASLRKIAVLYTPGVNETTVAEHTIGLMIAAAKHFYPHMQSVQSGTWKRQTGTELFGKTLAVLGLGRIGKEVVKRASAFGMTLIGHGNHWEDGFAKQYNLERVATRDEAIRRADVISLHMHLTEETRGLINKRTIELMKPDVIIVNTARGGLVNEQDVADACRAGRIRYAADVLAKEPIQAPHVFQGVPNLIVTPHVGSRTNESVVRQAVRATKNLINFLRGEKDYIQSNKF